jgi:DNA-binding CsgD family transcriptional regulator
VIGRRAECDALRAVLASARRGLSAALVLRGEPGIGKTALLEHAIASAPDFRALRATGIECEMEIGFAALYQLVQPLIPGIPDLPQPQRNALRAVFGLDEGPTPKPFLVGQAVLTLLSDAANSGTADPDATNSDATDSDATDSGTPNPGTANEVPDPESAPRGVLCAVDDAQWLDQASAEVLAFVARRLGADRIAFVFTLRDSSGHDGYFDGIPSLRVPALTAADAQRLLAERASGPVAPVVGADIAERVRGNPLALVETARELTAAQLAGVVLLPDPLPLGADAQDRYWRKAAALSPEQREFVLLAAAEPSGDLGLFERAAGILGLDTALADDTRIRELVTVADRVSLRHPLIRSAVYTGSARGARRRVHAAIAAASDPDRDQDQIAWHRAAAARGPDEEIAAVLERAAGRATRRGGFAASARFLRRAAELTPDDHRRGERLLTAAQAEFTAGRTDQATALAGEADRYLHDGRWQARALHLRGKIFSVLGDGHQAPVTLLRAAKALAPFDPPAARETLVDGLFATFYSGDLALYELLVEARTAVPLSDTRATIPDLLFNGYASFMLRGPDKGAPRLRRALSALVDDGLPDDQVLRWSGYGMWVAADLCDLDACRRLADRWIRLCRDTGALTALLLALDYLATWQAFTGQLDAAEASNAEARELLEAIGVRDLLAIRPAELLVPAWRGQEAELEERAAETVRDCGKRGQGGEGEYPHLPFAIAALGRRDYETALGHARALLHQNGPYLGSVILPYAVEAGVYGRDPATAGLALDRLVARTAASPTESSLGVLARSRALATQDTSPDTDVENLFADAIAHFERGQAGVSDMARTRLLYGEWLRRKRRPAQAREQLRAALESFEAMGAAVYAERARLELASAGAKDLTGAAPRPPARPDNEPAEPLTARESQIARLVAAGASNKEAAAQLFLSPNTIDYHLRHIFQKLGINNRIMLAAALQDQISSTAA